MPKEVVLITGATGHLGFRTLVFALQAGYRTRVAIRSPEQKDRISQTKSIRPHLQDVEFVVVPDITVENAYKEALLGVDYVLHIASPIASNPKNSGTNWNEIFYQPAIKGTVGILASANKQPTVKRIVVTSSVVVLDAPADGSAVGPYDIKPNPSPSKAESASRFDAYTFSKVFSHRAATEFMEKHKPSFSLVRILPGYIQGANELNLTKEEALSGSNKATLDAALGVVTDAPKLTAQVFLDDVAKAHVLSLQPTIASNGTSFLLAGNGGKGIPWDEVSSEVGQQFSEAITEGILHPRPGQSGLITNFDVASSEQALGFKFAGAKEMVENAVRQYLSLP